MGAEESSIVKKASEYETVWRQLPTTAAVDFQVVDEALFRKAIMQPPVANNQKTVYDYRDADLSELCAPDVLPSLWPEE